MMGRVVPPCKSSDVRWRRRWYVMHACARAWCKSRDALNCTYGAVPSPCAHWMKTRDRSNLVVLWSSGANVCKLPSKRHLVSGHLDRSNPCIHDCDSQAPACWSVVDSVDVRESSDGRWPFSCCLRRNESDAGRPASCGWAGEAWQPMSSLTSPHRCRQPW